MEELIRSYAIDLLEQAYETENLASQKAKDIEKCVLFRLIGNQSPELLFTNTLLRDAYINQIVHIALHLSQRTYTGYYSIIFNKIVRDKDPIILPEVFFEELYFNNLLTPEEKSKVQERYEREFKALYEAFIKSMEEDPEPKFFKHSYDNNLEDSQCHDLYSQCYNQICIKEVFESTGSLKEAILPTYSSSIDIQFITDEPVTGKLPHTFCLPTRDLLFSIVKDQINPLTGKRYSQSTIEQIRTNFPVELKLIEYALSKEKL